MVNAISSWANGIVVSVIIATIIEMIIPEGKNKKYIKTVIGVFVLFTIISPIFNKISNANISKDFQSLLNIIGMDDDEEIQTSSIQIGLEEIYISNLEADIISRLKEKGYKASNINMEIELKNKESYGSIYKMELSVEHENEDNEGIEIINEIKIEVGGNKQKDESNISNLETDELKNYLNSTYGVAKENIILN